MSARRGGPTKSLRSAGSPRPRSAGPDRARQGNTCGRVAQTMKRRAGGPVQALDGHRLVADPCDSSRVDPGLLEDRRRERPRALVEQDRRVGRIRAGVDDQSGQDLDEEVPVVVASALADVHRGLELLRGRRVRIDLGVRADADALQALGEDASVGQPNDAGPEHRHIRQERHALSRGLGADRVAIAAPDLRRGGLAGSPDTAGRRS